MLFEERLARPLGLTHSYWSAPLRPHLDPAVVRNPNLQGGLVTTAEDYAKFLTMLAANGLYRGRRILSPAAVAALETAHTLNIPMAYLPPGARGGGHYGLGNWCEVVVANGRCTLVSSPGAFGTYPWIDRTTGLYGIFFMRYRLPRVADNLREARRISVESARASAAQKR